MSKVSFRARQIDFNKPLPIIRSDAEILSEINENSLVNRGVPVLPSGMEKEEENEHHLVEVLHALQSKKASDVVIPVPEIEEDTLTYFKLYEKGFNPPNHFIHIRTIVLAEEEAIEYDMDSDDEAWLSKNEELNITPNQFESMIYTLERGCGQKVINLDEAKFLLQNYDTSLVIAIYDYWLTKRVQCRQPLMLTVRQEKKLNDQANDPYIAFRRRTERMQTRKNRKNDEYSYEKMLILREQMESLGDIIEKLMKRECIKKDLVETEKKIFNCRYQSKDFEGYLINEISSQCYRMPREKSSYANEYSTSPYQNDRLRSVPHTKSYQQGSPKRSRMTMKSTNKKKKSSAHKKSVFGSDRLMCSSAAEYSDEENFTSEGESQSFSALSSATKFSSFTRLQGCKYLQPTTTPASLIRERSSKLFHPYFSYSFASVPSVHSKFSNFTGYIRRRIGRGGRIIMDRIPSETVPPVSQTSSDVNQQLAKNDLNRINDRLEILSSQVLTVPPRPSYDGLDASLIKSLSNRLRWSNAMNNWKLSDSKFSNALKDQTSNLSPQVLRKMRLLANFDDRPNDSVYNENSRKGEVNTVSNKAPYSPLLTEPKISNFPAVINGSDGDSSLAATEHKNNRQSRTMLISNDLTSSSPKTAALNRSCLGDITTASNPNAANQHPTSTGATTILSSQTSSNSAQTTPNSNKRCRISLTSQIPGSNSLDLVETAKTNGSSNYCFFVPTPNNNSQTASNV